MLSFPSTKKDKKKTQRKKEVCVWKRSFTDENIVMSTKWQTYYTRPFQISEPHSERNFQVGRKKIK